jgi:23S rRNA maturation mini-RNase III
MDGGVVQYLGDTIWELFCRVEILFVNRCGHVDVEDVLIASS